MAELKVACLGAGSFVFGPSMLRQAILEHRLEGLELALMDIDADMVNLMAGVGRRMAEVSGIPVHISTHTDRTTALDGADFVICAVATEMWRRFYMDQAIIREHYPDHLQTEFGGVAGISYSLRQIALIEAIAADMRRLCPDAWLLNVSNPLPRVCQAAHEAGIKTVGFCSVSLSIYAMLYQLWGLGWPRYPFSAPRERWIAKTAGLNHLAWLLELRDQTTGDDMMPILHRRLAEGHTLGQPITEDHYRETGYLLSAGDDHIHDFLPPHPAAHSRQRASHGSPDKRQERIEILRAVGEGRTGWDILFEHESWERPFDLIAALTYDRFAVFHSLNLDNTGQIANLPQAVFVETPCTASRAGIVPETLTLPDPVLPYAVRTAQVTDTLVRAARERRLDLIAAAVELDPTIVDKAAGQRAVDACLAAHADLLPEYH